MKTINTIKNKYILPFSLNPDELDLINFRLSEFKKLNSQDSNHWFSELCFCLLTANSQAKKAIAIQQEIGTQGFLDKSQEDICNIIKSHAHRFHNNKSNYIVEARKFQNIKEHLKNLDDLKAREFLAKNIKGLGYKEASHFLRNVGYDNVAIIDRHILKFLYKYNFIKEIPKTITPKVYLEIENILRKFDLPMSKLDLLIWCHMTGNILK